MLMLDYNEASAEMDAIHARQYADVMDISAFRLAFVEGMQYYYRVARIEEARRENSQKNNHLPKMRYRDTDRVG